VAPVHRTDVAPGAAGSGVCAAPVWNADRACEHARLLLVPILERNGCDPNPLAAVLDALVCARGVDGPATVHWLLGWHRALPAGYCPLDVWRAGDLAALLRLVEGYGRAPSRPP
jgi:hypothetical protein